MIGYAELLSKETSAEVVQKSSEDILECASMALTLVDEVLDWSLVQSGSLKLNLKKCNVSELMSKVERIVRGKLDHVFVECVWLFFFFFFFFFF